MSRPPNRTAIVNGHGFDLPTQAGTQEVKITNNARTKSHRSSSRSTYSQPQGLSLRSTKVRNVTKHERVVEATEFYDYADSLRASTNNSPPTDVVTESLLRSLREKASLTSTVDLSEPSSRPSTSIRPSLREKTSLTSSISQDESSRRPSTSMYSQSSSTTVSAPSRDESAKRPSISLRTKSNQSDRAPARPPTPPRPKQSPQEFLQLMHATKGLMHGQFMFRRGSDQAWSSTYGYIAPHIGSLLYTSAGKTTHEALVHDLSTCRVTATTDRTSQETFLRLQSRQLSREVHFRPAHHSYFNAWFAAFLCWRPKSLERRLRKSSQKPHRPRVLSEIPSLAQRKPAKSTWRETQTLRQEEVILLESSHTPTATSVDEHYDNHMAIDPRLPRDVKRIKASCVLRGSGQLSLSVGSEAFSLANVDISTLPRSAIQRVDYSVFRSNLVLAIRPRLSNMRGSNSRLSPIYISLPSRESLETWHVLLQTMAMPERYGNHGIVSGDEWSLDINLPDSDPGYSSMIRIQHDLTIKVNKARLPTPSRKRSSTISRTTTMTPARPFEYYVEVLLDDQMCALTARKRMGGETLHFYEAYTPHDVPSQLATVGFRLMRQEVSSNPITRQSFGEGYGENEHVSRLDNSSADDQICGEAVLDLEEVMEMNGKEQTVTLLDEDGEIVGDVTVSLEHQEEVMLMETEYDRLIEMLERLAVPLTVALSERSPQYALPRLAERLLNIFLTCGNVQEWLMALAEKEITSSAPAPGTASSQAAERDSTVLLFRGNTLLTKALDLYMKRVGQSYLEEVLARKMREIAIYEPDCEVDPNRLSPNSNLDKNWRRLMDVTKETWQLIYQSVDQCPMELRAIFSHIRRCAVSRFGKTAPSARYTSVSGFLFLRFFCAATLNPQLFGLIEDDTSITAPRAHRTFTLVAKALQGLANLSEFGNKESWMAPMNAFAVSHRKEFKNFIDRICTIDEDWVPPNGLETHLIAHSSTRTQYMRLSKAARDGIPSLPYLIDRTRDAAGLVRFYIQHAMQDSRRASVMSTASVASVESSASTTSVLSHFHAACVKAHRKTMQLYAQADVEGKEMTEEGEVVDNDVTPAIVTQRWASIAERMETRPDEFWMTRPSGTISNSVQGGRSSSSHRPKETGSKLGLFLPKKGSTDREREKDTQSIATTMGSSVSGSSERQKSPNAAFEKKKQRRRSPARQVQDAAMRKLGWM